MRYLGIDPGKSGALAVIIPHKRGVLLFPFEKLLDCEIWNLFKLHGGPGSRATIESVHAFPGQGVVSMFSFGTNFGFLKACLIASGTFHSFVTPQRWQKELNIVRTEEEKKRKDKTVTLRKAQKLFPKWMEFSHKTADAALLAYYCKRYL